MKLTILGLGYIGLPTAIMFANYGQKVYGMDTNTDVIRSLKNVKVHIEEPGLQEELAKAIDSGNFHVGLKPQKADAFIISVPTPNNTDLYKSCDLKYVINAVKEIVPVLEFGNTIIVESTMAPRSTEDVIKPILEENGFIIGKNLFLVHCPERVLPGQVMYELIHNNRIIGGITEECTKKGKEIYSVFVKGELLETTASTAEMSKLMENTYRDVNIALANELVKISDVLNINALDVIYMANKHPRVNIHSPGPGVGGHCLAVDPYFISSKAPKESPLIQTAREINSSMPKFILEKVDDFLLDVNDPKIVVMGLSYKGDIDDIRESPAIDIYMKLVQSYGENVFAYDPHVKLNFVKNNLEELTHNADVILILTDHSEFKRLTPEILLKNNNAVILDTKNILSVNNFNERYYNLGDIPRLNR